jgi:hypothetical protein
MIACFVAIIIAAIVGIGLMIVANYHITNFQEDKFVHFVEQKVNGANGNGH